MEKAVGTTFGNWLTAVDVYVGERFKENDPALAPLPSRIVCSNLNARTLEVANRKQLE